MNALQERGRVAVNDRPHGTGRLVPMQPQSTCSVPNCSSPHKARTYCNKHLSRIVRHGDPFTGRVLDAMERFVQLKEAQHGD